VRQAMKEIRPNIVFIYQHRYAFNRLI